MQQPPLRDRTQGKWASLLPLLGIGRQFLSGKNCPCPFCGGKDRFRFINKDGTGNWVCNQCGRGDGIGLAERWLNQDFADTAKHIEAILGEAKADPAKPKRDPDADRRIKNAVWNGGALITAADPAGVYLQSRGLAVPQTSALRYSARVPYDDFEPARLCPAMLAKITAPDGKPVNVHRTFLTADGQKGGFGKVRKMMPGEITPGSAVRLFPPGPTLGIAEGIETALAAAQLFSIPVWAGISAWGVETFQEPEGVTELVIFGDSDASYTGQAASYVLAKKAVSRKVPSVRVQLPDAGDWNDVLGQHAA